MKFTMLNDRIKRAVKLTFLYQHIKRAKFLPVSIERYNQLPEDEKTPIRICVNRGNKTAQIKEMFSSIRINYLHKRRFISWIDTGLVIPVFGSMTDNVPPNYSLIIEHSLQSLIDMNSGDNEIKKSNRILLCAIRQYIIRIINTIENDSNVFESTKEYFRRMLTCRAESLEEALQRILFWNSIFWQSRHRLIGLGRLDLILSRFADEKENIDILVEFYKELHRYYIYKSNKVSLGDTGQIIILGGTDDNGEYYYNNLTYSFIKAMIIAKLPDPKILLRVSDNMPMDLLGIGIDCISTGIGCPLLSNDDVVIPALEKFGYTHEDACNYVTSACWEPVAYGKSLEKNNILDLNFAEAITMMYDDKEINECSNFEDFLRLYYKCLKKEIIRIKEKLDKVQWEQDPIMTLFTMGCVENNKDISSGGAVYNDYGILGVGMSNAVNSLLNIKHLVFEEKKYSICEICGICNMNYDGKEEVRKTLSDVRYYGHDDNEPITLTNSIIQFVYDNLSSYRNRFGGKLKWGLSSSNYLENGKKTKATLDGRHSGEPLGVHISCEDNLPYTELVLFASKLDYSGNKSNGNVVDFFVSPSFIINNREKFLMFIKKSIKQGFFQMQMNVVDSKTLIDAKSNPKKYPNLIVRVWGFSAYFNDLPESYKDLLIRRAIQSERVA